MLLNCVAEEDSCESLDCKEIKSVNLKGNQSWLFVGRTDAKTEASMLWPSDAKSWLPGKDPDAGKDWRREEKGTTEDEMAGWPHWHDGHESEQALGDADGQKFEQTLGDGEGQGSLAMLQSMGSQRVRHDWVPELMGTYYLYSQGPRCCKWKNTHTHTHNCLQEVS